MGTPAFAVPSLEALVEAGHEILTVVTQPDRGKGRGRELSPSPVKAAATALGIPVVTPVKIREASFADSLRSLAPDFIVVVAYGRILPESVLAVPSGGCVNLHASLLPDYRGAAPINWSIINGDAETGVSTMLMDAGLDTGPVLLEKKVEIAGDDTTGTLGARLSALGAPLLVETIEGLLEGRLKPKPQDDEKATFAPVLKKEDGRIDWSRSATEIRNLIRGMHPWPGAFTQWKGKLKIHTATAANADDAGAAELLNPGTIVDVSGGTVDVACGSGILKITGLQPENKRRMSAEEFIRGYRIKSGEQFS